MAPENSLKHTVNEEHDEPAQKKLRVSASEPSNSTTENQDSEEKPSNDANATPGPLAQPEHEVSEYMSSLELRFEPLMQELEDLKRTIRELREDFDVFIPRSAQGKENSGVMLRSHCRHHRGHSCVYDDCGGRA